MKSLAPIITIVALAACQPPNEPSPNEPSGSSTSIDLAALVDDGALLQGIAADPASGTLHVLVERRGILEIDIDGALVRERPIGVNGLADRPYRDLVALGDQRMLLIADSEGYVWDELTQQLSVHFCVEPGFIECTDEFGVLIDTDGNGVCDWDECISEGALIDQNGDAVCDWEQCARSDGTVYARDDQGLCDGGGEPLPEPEPEPEPEPVEPLAQQNDALALVGNTILAAPRFFDAGSQVEAALRRYDLLTGTPTGGADITGLDLDLMGLTAIDGELVGVEPGRLARFGMDGRFNGARAIDIDAPAGATALGGELLVLDRENRRVVGVPLD